MKGFLIAVTLPLACVYIGAPPADQARAKAAATRALASAGRTLPVRTSLETPGSTRGGSRPARRIEVK